MSTESSSGRVHDGISLLYSTLFMGIGYGTILTIYIQCLFSLAQSPMRQAPRLSCYISIMFILETLYVVANSRRVWIAFITDWYVFVAVDLSFNIITTSLITTRIMTHRAALRKSVGKQKCVVSSFPLYTPAQEFVIMGGSTSASLR